MVKTQQAAVGMWSTCKVVHHVHSLHRHALRLGGFQRLFVRSCTGWEWSTCKVVHDPLHRCISGVWGCFWGGAALAEGPSNRVLLRLGINAKSSALAVQVVRLVKLRMADKGVGKLAPHAPAGGAAAGLVSVSTTCKNTFSEGKPPSAWGSVPPAAPRASTNFRASANRVQCRLRLHELQQIAGFLQTGFSAACGFTRINFLPSKPPINFTYRGLFFAPFCYFSYVICAK